MKFDWTVNVPLLLSTLGIVWAASGRISRIETLLNQLLKRSEAHELEDDRRFEEEQRSRNQVRESLDGRLREMEQRVAALSATPRSGR